MLSTNGTGRFIAPARDPGDDAKRRPDEWQPIGGVVGRILKQSIVSAGLNGSMRRERAGELIQSLGLRHL